MKQSTASGCTQAKHASRFASVANAGDYPERVFGRRMRQERLLRGWRQEDLAARVGLIPSAISKAEAGRRLIRLDEAVAIADAFGLPLGAMLIAAAGDRAAAVEELTRRATAAAESAGESTILAARLLNEALNLAEGLDRPEGTP
jgi:transcriptional regulator with XRE-family HTH domain